MKLLKKDWLAILAIGLFVLLFFKPVIAGDGFGYYTLLEGMGRDGTINLQNQLHYNQASGGETVFYYEKTGIYSTQYAPGFGLLAMPLYKITLWLDDFSLFHIQDSFFLAERGDILIHMLSVALTSLVFVAVAIAIAFYLLKKLGFEKQAWLAVLLGFFGSPLIRYATYDLSYTHAVEAGLLAIALFLFFEKKPAWLIGFVLGIMTLVRYSSALFAVPFILYWLWKNNRADSIKLVAGALPFGLLLLAYFAVAYGSPFISSYQASGSLENNFSLPIHFLNVLFSLSADPAGLFWWTPLVVLSFVGLLKWSDERKWVLTGLFVVLLIVTSMSYKGTTGFSFSHRYFAALFVPIIIGLAVLLKNAKWRKPLIALGCYTVLLFFLHLAGVDFYNGFPSLPEVYRFWIVEGNLPRLPELLFNKLGIVRLVLLK
ncbi:glycosyltransferase family 39 protein [Candidatus Micrarchaeota archaeon]|nr:glycosyltransferase family 39 protein [Candidatus Micrarchaeota archaeon]